MTIPTLTSPVLAAALVASTPALAAEPAPAATPAASEARIPFPNHGGIYDWQAVDRETLYIQDASRHWYLAKLMAPCLDLDFAERIGFVSSGGDVFDRFSSILVKGQSCPLQSLVRSGPPPKTAKHHRT